MNYASAYTKSFSNIREEYNSNDEKSLLLMLLLTIGCFLDSRRPVCQLSLHKYFKNVDSQQENHLFYLLKIINQSFFPT
jgi:hypothetical protein